MLMRAAPIVVVLALRLAAQHAPDPNAVIATAENPVAIELARRELVVGERSAVRGDVLEAVLRHEDAARRLAALSVLAHHDLLGDAARALVEEDEEPFVRRLLIRHADAELARAALASDTEPRLRAAALHRLVELGAVRGDDHLTALADPAEEVRRAAAEQLVFRTEPLPTTLFADLSAEARRTVLATLAVRPRAAARPWVRKLAERPDLDLAEQLLIRMALPPEEWARADAQLVLDALATDDGELHRLAYDIADLMPTPLADGMVVQVHERLLAGADVGAMLRALDDLSPQGERHLAALARVLPERSRHEIVLWLISRRSPVVDELAEDALVGRAPLESFVIREASASLLADAELAARMRELLEDDQQRADVRTAAFDALVGSGVWHDGLLDFALRPGSEADRLSAVRRVLSVDPDTVPDPVWDRLLSHGSDRIVRATLARMAGAPRLDRAADRVLELATGEGRVALAAADVALRTGSPELAENVWSRQSPARRQQLALALRDREAEWALGLMAGTPDSPAVLETRIALGDRASFETVLADPRSIPSRWFVRLGGVAPRMLRTEDLATVRAHLFGEDAIASLPHRIEMISWVAARPDLGAEELLLAARERGEPEERDVALRGLLALDGPARRIHEELQRTMADGLTESEEDLAFEAAGALAPPLDAEGARLVARLALVEPLGDPEEELGDALGRAALQNLVWQQLGRKPFEAGEAGEAAWTAAVDESLAHPNALAASRRRLGELLATFARDEASRVRFGAPLARAVVAAPDLDREHVGGARLIQAEAFELAGEFAAAAEAYDDAARLFLAVPIDPLQLRAFVGDGYRATGEIWQARLPALAALNRARAAAQAGDREAAEASLARAAELAEGDSRATRAVEEFKQEFER